VSIISFVCRVCVLRCRRQLKAVKPPIKFGDGNGLRLNGNCSMENGDLVLLRLGKPSAYRSGWRQTYIY